MAVNPAIVQAISQGSASSMSLSGNIISAGQVRRNREQQLHLATHPYSLAVADLKRAGLNPALMYGGGAPGIDVPNLEAPKYDFTEAARGLSSAGAAYSQLLTDKKEREKIDAEIKLIESQAEVNKSQVPNIESEIAFRGATQVLNDLKAPLERGLTAAQASHFYKQNEVSDQTIKNLVEEVQLKTSQKNLNEMEREKVIQETVAKFIEMRPYLQKAGLAAQWAQILAKALPVLMTFPIFGKGIKVP